MAKKSNNKGPVLARRVKDRQAITIYLEEGLLEKLEALRDTENRSRGNMVQEIIRRFFAGQEVKQ